MESAIDPLDNCDHKSEHYLWGIFCFIFCIYSHSFTNIGWLRVGLQKMLLQRKWMKQEHPSSREGRKVGQGSI